MDPNPQDAELLRKLLDMPEETQKRFRLVMRLVAMAAVNDDPPLLVVFADNEHLSLLSFNMDEQQLMAMTSDALDVARSVVQGAALDKTMYN